MTITARELRTIVAAALLAVLPAASSAGGPGSVGMQVLKTDMSPRAAGMGGAFVAVADDVYTLNYNPAGLARLYVPEISAMHLAGFDDSSLQYAAYAMPLPFIGLGGLEKPVAGVSLMMASAGNFDYKYIMPDGSVFARSYDAQKDLALTFGYGEKVFSDEVDIEGYRTKVEQYVGLNLKYIRSVLLEDEAPPSTFAFDGGWLVAAPDLGLNFGASVANFGGGLKYGSEITKLPSILRLGLAYERPTVLDQSVLLAAEYDLYMNESLKSVRLGLEYHFQKIFNLRLGYRGAEDNKGLTTGIGVHYEDMALDFSMGLGNEVYNASQVAFSYKFSGIKVKDARRKVQFRDEEPEPQKPAKARQPAKQDRKPARQAKPSQEKKKDSDFFWLY